jgi:hypothetical protein
MEISNNNKVINSVRISLPESSESFNIEGHLVDLAIGSGVTQLNPGDDLFSILPNTIQNTQLLDSSGQIAAIRFKNSLYLISPDGKVNGQVDPSLYSIKGNILTFYGKAFTKEGSLTLTTTEGASKEISVIGDLPLDLEARNIFVPVVDNSIELSPTLLRNIILQGGTINLVQ